MTGFHLMGLDEGRLSWRHTRGDWLPLDADVAYTLF